MKPLQTLHLAAALALLPVAATAQLSPPQMLPGDAAIEASAGVSEQAEMARGGSQYLVVWSDSRTEFTGTVSSGGYYAPGPRDVFAARLDASGNLLDTTPIAVSVAPFEQLRPKVSWNGTNWLVIWQSRRAQQYTTTAGIYGARVSPSGQLLDTTPFVIDDDDGVDEMFPTVSSDGTGWAVAWMDYDPVQGLQTINSAVIDGSGSIVLKRVLTATSSGFYNPYHSNLCFAQDRYLWTYEGPSSPSGPSGIVGRFLDTSLSALGGDFQIAPTGGTPDVASDGNGFYVTWTTGGSWKYTYGTPVAIDGTVAIPGGLQLTSYGQVGDTEPRVTWDGLQWSLTVERWGTNTQLESYRVDATGQPIGGPTILLAHSSTITGSLIGGGAGSPGDTVVVWMDGWVEYSDLLVTTLDQDHVRGPIGTVTISEHAQVKPDLAGDPQQGYLLVFLSRSAGMVRVHGQRLDPQGQPIDAEPLLILWGDERIDSPRVAWNGNLWLVVWADTLQRRVFGRRVASDGTLLDPISLDIMAGDMPDVGALGTDFVVLGSVETKISGEFYRDLYSMRVGSTGALLDPAQRWVGYNYAENPRVEALGDRWFATWANKPHYSTTTSSIHATFIDAGGAALPEFGLESSPTGRNYAPDVAVAGSIATVGWSDGNDVRIRRVSADGTLLGSTAGLVVSNAPNTQFEVKVGNDGTDSFVTWTDYRIHAPLEAGVGDAYGARVDAAGTVLDPGGLALGADPGLPEGNTAVIGGNGVTIAVHVALRPEAGEGAYRIVTRTLGAAAAGTAYCFGSGTTCPCGNGAGATEGCANSTGTGGRLDATGSTSVAADTLTFTAVGLPPGKSALLFQGLGAPSGGSAPFGAGLRCVAGSVQRFPLATSTASGTLQIGPGLAAHGGWATGQTLGFQVWHRDPLGPCAGASTNVTSAVSVTFTP